MPKIPESLLFDFFTKAANDFYPDSPNGFVCPLCLQTFNSLAGLNRAHLWPESLGGRIFTLACCKCNSGIGSRIEKHEVERVKYLSLEKVPVKERIDGVEGHISSFYSVKDIDGQPTLIMEVSAKHSNPSTLAVKQQMFETGEILKKELVVSFRGKFNKRTATLTYLHFAYMALFHLTGYSWVATAIANDIRHQLNHPKKGNFPVFLVPFTSQEILGSADATEPVLMEVLSPFEVRGLLVATPELTYKNNQRTAIWIPRVFDDRSSIYRLDKSQGTRFNYRFLTSIGREPGKLFCYEGPVR